MAVSNTGLTQKGCLKMVVDGGRDTYRNDETSYIAQVKGEFWKFSLSFFTELTYQFSRSREYHAD